MKSGKGVRIVDGKEYTKVRVRSASSLRSPLGGVAKNTKNTRIVPGGLPGQGKKR